MSISLKTHKLLWGRSGNRCAICRNILSADETSTDDDSLIGEECHIIAKKSKGSRGTDEIEQNNINKVDNLILLCRNHHKIVDDQPATYTSTELSKLKTQHEDWVKSNLCNVNLDDQKNDIQLAIMLDKWAELSNIEKWDSVFYGIVADGIPRISIVFYNKLLELKLFLFKRFKNDKYVEIENELSNFTKILSDFILVFDKFKIKIEDNYWTERFYKIEEWNPEKYNELGDYYEYHVDLLQDLFFELTRSANRIILRIRKSFSPNYRQIDGLLHISRGPDENLRSYIYKPLYENDNVLYQGLIKFALERKNRDICFGSDDKFIRRY